MIREFGNDASPRSGDEEVIAQNEAATLDTLRARDMDREEESGNIPKIAAASVMGLLLLGGGIYAYQASRADTKPAPVQAAKPPVPKAMAMAPVPTPVAVEAAAPQAVTSASPQPAAALVAAPAPVKQARVMRRAANPALDAPMTLTPETAPPPQQETATAAISAPTERVTQDAIVAPPATVSNQGQ